MTYKEAKNQLRGILLSGGCALYDKRRKDPTAWSANALITERDLEALTIMINYGKRKKKPQGEPNSEDK